MNAKTTKPQTAEQIIRRWVLLVFPEMGFVKMINEFEAADYAYWEHWLGVVLERASAKAQAALDDALVDYVRNLYDRNGRRTGYTPATLRNAINAGKPVELYRGRTCVNVAVEMRQIESDFPKATAHAEFTAELAEARKTKETPTEEPVHTGTEG